MLLWLESESLLQEIDGAVQDRYILASAIFRRQPAAEVEQALHLVE